MPTSPFAAALRAPDRHRLPASRATSDLLIVALVTLLAAFVSARIELTERLQSVTRPLEWLQVDELPNVLLVLAAALAWFAWRRYCEAGRLLAQRAAAEAALERTLTENRRLAREHVQAQETERRRLARELHDEAGQTINAIKIDAVQSRDRAHDDEDHRIASGILANVAHLHATVRDLIRELRPVALDDLGLRAAIEYRVDEWRPRLPDTHIDLDLAPDLDGLDETANITVYRVLQEALTNVARHARAVNVTIRVARQHDTAGRDTIDVHVVNDGVAAATRLPPARGSGGLGLIGMRERVQALGGAFGISVPAPGQFAVNAHIPVAEAHAA